MSGAPPHDHDHGRHHTHPLPAGADTRYLTAALGLLVAFLVVEVVAAFAGSSLALFADAGHMLTDVAALAAGVGAARLAVRPASGIWTFGWKRAEVLSAAGNGLLLVAAAAVISVEAVRRLVEPAGVRGGLVLVTALVGAVVNVAATAVLSRADRDNINVRGSLAHIVTDLYAFAGTAAAGLVVLTTGWDRADAVASLAVAALMIRAAWGLLGETGRILLQAAPDSVPLELVRQHIIGVDHVLDIHDLHVWTLSSDLPSLSAHVVVEDHCFASGHAPQILDTLQACLGDHFDVEHSTFQLEPASHADHEKGHHP